MDILKPVLSLGKLLAGISAAFFTCGERQPLIFFVGLGWYIWLRHKELVSRQKSLTSLGLGFIVVGWGVGWLVHYYGVKAEGHHFPGQGDDWMILANLSFWISFGGMTLGLLALAYVDAFGVYPAVPQDAQSEKSAPDADNVWPPAPKLPR